MNATEHKMLVLFDGVCNFCNASINFIIRHDKNDHFRFLPLQSPTGKQLLQQFQMDHQPMNSIVLMEHTKLYRKSTAILRIAKKLNGLYPLLYALIIIPAFIRDPVYDLIARNRYKWFGKKERCMVPTPEVKQKFIS